MRKQHISKGIKAMMSLILAGSLVVTTPFVTHAPASSAAEEEGEVLTGTSWWSEYEISKDRILKGNGSVDVYKRQLEGNPVTIRFLDPPLHEFVPTEEADIKKLAEAQGKSVEDIKAIIASLHEFNPMMGHRGCRLAVTYPEIAKMQTKAVIRCV